MSPFYIFFVAIPTLIGLVNGFQCPLRCIKENCPPLDNSTCHNGIVKDICDCCPVCASGVGEICGGINYGPGICAAGTRCIIEVPFGLPFPKYLQSTGTCRPINPNAIVCPEPACSVEYCTANSAMIDDYNKEENYENGDDNGSSKRSTTACSGKGLPILGVVDTKSSSSCMVTVCEACRLITTPNCSETTTGSLDIDCLADHYASDVAILELDDPRAFNYTGKIVCYAPETPGTAFPSTLNSDASSSESIESSIRVNKI